MAHWTRWMLLERAVLQMRTAAPSEDRLPTVRLRSSSGTCPERRHVCDAWQSHLCRMLA